MYLCAVLPAILLTYTPATLEAQQTIEKIEMGFDGKVVLGRWVPFTVTVAGPLQASRLQVETLDGDAVPVNYLQFVGGSQLQYRGLVRMGRVSGITVRLAMVIDNSEARQQGQTQRVMAERRFSLEELQQDHEFLPGTTRMTAVVGLQQAEDVDVFSIDKSLADVTVAITDADALPDHPLGWDAIGAMIIVPRAMPRLALEMQGGFDLQPAQAQAIVTWAARGGDVLLCGGLHAADWFGKGSPLQELAPGPFVENTVTGDTGAIELLVGSNEQLATGGGPELPLSVFDVPESAVESRIGTRSLIARRAFGFGTVSFVATDFAEQPLRGWNGRRKLLSAAMGLADAASSNEETRQTGRVSHIGYEDIVGQLRAALDRFQNVSFITFTSVALLITLFILAVGPGDYLFLRRLIGGRMELTWVSFTLLSLAFCGLAIGLAAWTKSSSTEINQVEIIDIDARDGTTRGNLWANLYSPGTGSYDLALPSSLSQFGALRDSWVSWQGLPGSGLGGMQSTTDRGLYRRSYESKAEPLESTAGGETWTTTLHGIPMQNASTKMLTGQWTGQFDDDLISNLRRSASTDALFGTITNPFPFELADCMLMYGDWVYLLERPLRAHETIVVEDDMREKTIVAYFTRRSKQGDDDVNTAWDPSDTNLSRILQLMMFHEAIGGRSWCRLTHDFQPSIDLSRQLGLGQAVLTGRMPRVTTRLLVNDEPFASYDKELTMFRVVFPVEKDTARRR